MRKEIWCTLGPSSLNDRVIGRLEELGVSLFRLNLSHTKIDALPDILNYLLNRTQVPVCLDTEGAQIRTGDLAAGKIRVSDNSTIYIHRAAVPGDEHNLNLYPLDMVNRLKVGDLLKIDAEVLAHVVAVEKDRAILKVLNGGGIGQNKAVTVLEREIEMPPLTEKDAQALALGDRLGIRHVALSFANRPEDVDAIRALVHEDTRVISKIECLNGLVNLTEIAARSDALLIDRGDLSRQVSLEKIPALQKDILRYCRENGVRVYVATNLMESMVTSPNPTRAEVNDVFTTLMDGAHGLVLAAETAIGAYPVGAAMMVRKIIKEVEQNFRWRNADYHCTSTSVLVEPHGGTLVNRDATSTRQAPGRSLKKLRVRDTDLMDCALIANGTYSPLTGFMNREQLRSVLDTYRLPNGLVWTLPILLQVKASAAKGLRVGERIALTGPDGQVYALLDLSDIFSIDFEEVAQKWFGTTSRSHPGVKRLAEGGDRFLAGEVTLVSAVPSEYQQYALTPQQTRQIFHQKGWSKVVGFHTRNVPHRAHEYIQLSALDSVHADGLFISPIVGPKKLGDFLEGPILKSYQLLLENHVYPAGKVVLGAFSTYPRYCGPREAVFTALCRKNMGCNYFVVGRDHTGLGEFYRDDQTRKLFDELGDLGVTPVFFNAIGYDPATQSYTELLTPTTVPISGSEVRKALREGKRLPDWLVRDLVQDYLSQELARNRAIFYESERVAA